MTDTRVRRLASAAALSAALGIAGCGGGDDTTTEAPAPSERAELAQHVPGDAVAFTQVAIKPEGTAKDGVVDVAQKLGGVQDPGAQLLRELNTGDVQYSRDVDPAVGDEVAGFVGPPQGRENVAALVFEVEDAGKAAQLGQRDFTREVESDGQSYRVDPDDGSAYWLGDDVGAVGTEAGVKAVIAAQDGQKLSDASTFTGPVGKLPGGEDIAVAWYDPTKAADAIANLQRTGGSSSAQSPFGGAFGGGAGSADALRQAFQSEGSGPAAVAVQPRPGRISIEGYETRTKAPTADPAAAARSVGQVPGDAFAAFGTGDIGTQISRSLEQAGSGGEQQIAAQVRQVTGLDLQDDLLAWMGSGAVFVRGSGITDIGGGLVVQAKDPAKAESALTRISSRLQAQGAQVREDAVSGADTSIGITGAGPVPVLAAVKGDRFVLGVNAQAVQSALDGGSPLSSSPAYGRARQALGGMQPVAVVDGTKTASLIDNLTQLAGTAGSSPDAQRAINGVKRVQLLAAGSAADGNNVRSRFVLTYR